MNTKDKAQHIQRMTLPLYNLGCSSGDALTVERILARQTGVSKVYANPVTEMVYVDYDPVLTHEGQLAAIIKNAGYGPTEGI